MMLLTCVLLQVLFRLSVEQDADSFEFTRANLVPVRPTLIRSSVTIDCETTDPAATVTLLRSNANGTKFLQVDGLNVKLKGQIFTVFISRVQDSGQYICNSEKEGNLIQKILTIVVVGVSGDVPAPDIVPKKVSVSEGNTVNIKCSTSGPLSTLSWLKGTVPVNEDQVSSKQPRYELGNIVVESVFTITDVALSDVGVYTCRAALKSDNLKYADVHSTLEVQGQSLYWVKDEKQTLNAITSNPRSTVIISCILSHPAKYIDFYRWNTFGKEERIVSDGVKYQIKNLQELIVMDTALSDSGKYTCKTAGLQNKDIQLFVNPGGATNPSVFVSPRNIELDYNGSGNVTCTTLGNNAIGEWFVSIFENSQSKLRPVPRDMVRGEPVYKPGQPLRKVYTLIFKNVTVEDARKYQCHVTVDGKTAFSSVDVIVKEPKAPKIREFDSLVIAEGKSATLDCRNKGAPKPSVSFLKDGFEVKDGERGYEIDGKRLLIEKAVYPDHNGTYMCLLENMFGKASEPATILVTVAPAIDKLKSFEIVGGSAPLEATCKILRSNPMPIITWQLQLWPCPSDSKDYKCSPLDGEWQDVGDAVIDSGINVTVAPVSSEPTMLSTITLHNPEKNYFLKCLSKHPYGSDSHVITGIVDTRDASKHLRLSQEIVNRNELQNISILCEGTAGLFRSLSWKKDGVELVPDGTHILIASSGETLLEAKISTLNLIHVKEEMSGNYQCEAVPARKEDRNVQVFAKVKIFSIFPPKILGLQVPSTNEGETVVLRCIVNANPPPAIKWYRNDGPIQGVGQIISKEDCAGMESGRFFQVRQTVDIYSVEPVAYELVICKAAWKLNVGTFKCSGENYLGVAEEQGYLQVYAPPSIVTLQREVYVVPGHAFSKNCSAEGNPMPLVHWQRFYGRSYESVTRNSTRISYLNFTSVSEADYGAYRCVAWNYLGEVHVDLTLKRPLIEASRYDGSSERAATVSLIVALIAAALIIIILSVLAIVLYKRKRLYGGFYILSIPPAPDYFKKLDPTKSIVEQVHKLPYFPEWEFPRSKVKLRNRIGAGAFGEVYIADAVGIVTFDPRYKLGLKHKPLLSRRRLSARFSSARLSRTDTGSCPKGKEGKSQTSKVAVKKLKDDATTIEHKDLVSEMKILIHIGQHENIVNLLGACTKGRESEVMVLLEYCPHGNLLSFMKGRRQMFKPIWSKQHIGMEREFTTFDLIVAAYQIAKGLEFLAARKCVHRDVAARNVLVGENYVMKLADFGLARDVYEDESYVKVSGGLLPIKWMAIESIFDRVFTHQSDVWAYGVLLWELMTLGGSPYPGLPAKDLPEFLSDGRRMEQPQLCPNEIYALMCHCWQELPSERPFFTDIVIRLARVIESHCEDPAVYLDKCHISGSPLMQDNAYLRPVDLAIGSYHFAAPPPYSASFGDRLADSDKITRFFSDDDNANTYIPDKACKRDADDGAIPNDYEQAVDSHRGGNQGNALESQRNPEQAGNSSYENTPPACTDALLSGEPISAGVDQDEDKDVDENSVLLAGCRTPSPVKDLGRYVDKELARLDDANYVNA